MERHRVTLLVADGRHVTQVSLERLTLDGVTVGLWTGEVPPFEPLSDLLDQAAEEVRQWCHPRLFD